MKKFLIAAVAVATIAGAAGAASAQPYGGPHRPDYDAPRGGGYDSPRDGGYRGDRGDYRSDTINAKQRELAMRIAQGERRGRLNRNDAHRLRGELARVSNLERQFRMTRGIDRREFVILEARLDRLEARIFAEMRDGRRYGEGYGGGYDRH